MQRAVVVRNPYSRLVSLYLHHVHWQAALGFGGPDFGDFCRLIAEGSQEPFYAWNLCEWLGPNSGETMLRVESLESDLAAIGILFVRLAGQQLHGHLNCAKSVIAQIGDRDHATGAADTIHFLHRGRQRSHPERASR